MINGVRLIRRKYLIELSIALKAWLTSNWMEFSEEFLSDFELSILVIELYMFI